MNVYTFIVITVISVYSTARPIDLKWPNVGTVLFSDKELHRKVWPKSDIALLEARRHFQHIIPPPELVSPSYNFVDTLIDYFKQSYTTIKNTVSNPEDDIILTKALSDIIGGYFKLLIIPTTKFAYYRGAINQEQAFRVFSFYDEVKKYLRTDGSGWRSPDNMILKTIFENIPQISRRKVPQSHVRSPNTDPCEIFAYFEKTPNGFTIPLPYINWEQNTMFVPLKNQSLVHLGSSQYSNVLVNYYTAAKLCLQRRSPNITNQFDVKVQSWLSDMVLPHLTDEPLYVALGNVLMLFNYTEIPHIPCPWEESLSLSLPTLKITDSATNICSFKCKVKCFLKEVLNKITSLFIYMWHHKLVTLCCLLLLEILWCMCATNCLKTVEKKDPFCICKRIKKLISDDASRVPEDETDDDGKDEPKKQKSEGKKKRCNLFNKAKKSDTSPEEASDSDDDSEKKEKNIADTNSSDSSKAKKRRKCPISSCCKKKNKKEKSDQKEIVKKIKDDIIKDETISTSTPEYIDDMKCNEECKPCHSPDISPSDKINSQITTDKPILRETTAEKGTQDTLSSQSSSQKCSVPCSIKDSELDQILNYPEKDTSNNAANSSSGSKLNKCKPRNEKKICHVRTIDVKYPEEIHLSGKKLDVNSKPRRRTHKNVIPLSKQQTHVAYSSVDSGSRSFDSCSYEVVEEIQSCSKNISSKKNTPQIIRYKKIHKSDITKNVCTSQDQHNIVTLFQNESPQKKVLSRSVSIKTPFSTLQESASSLLSEFSNVNQTEKNHSNFSQIDSETSYITKMSSQMVPEQQKEIIKNQSLKQEIHEKLRLTKIVSQVSDAQADDRVRKSKFEKARSGHKNVQRGQDRIITPKDIKEENIESMREHNEVLREVRRKHREMKHIPETHERHRIKEFQKTDERFSETKKSLISKEKGIIEHSFINLEKQQEILKEAINKESTDRNMLMELKGRSGYLAIKIDRPNTEINVDLTGTMMRRIDRPTKHILTEDQKVTLSEKQKEKHINVQGIGRNSKIPKRATRELHSKSPDPDSRLPQSLATKPKTIIPQPEKRAADDMAIHIKTSTDKLNLTL